MYLNIYGIIMLLSGGVVMVNEIPKGWNYTKELETLFFFYQRSEEMLSKYSVDTYHVKMHNSLSLCKEALKLYKKLEELNIVKDYYDKYIIDILDEIIFSIHYDDIIKQILGNKLETVISGIESAKKNHSLAERWLNLIIDNCPISIYIQENQKVIKNCVLKNSNKTDLQNAMNRYYSSLIHFGYTEEYIYRKVKEFFQYNNNGKYKSIDNTDILDDFFNVFDMKENEYEFIFLIDNKIFEYLDSIGVSSFRNDINYCDEKDIAKLCKYKYGLELVTKYNEKRKSNNSLKLIKYRTKSIYYFKATSYFDNEIDFAKSLESYFKHNAFPTNIFYSVVKITKINGNEDYIKVNDRDALQKRPYVDQDVINNRVKSMLNFDSNHLLMWFKLLTAIKMHHEAVKMNDANSMLRDFWIALETLFSNPKNSNTKSNVFIGTTSVVQKTYILKILRTLYHFITEATTDFERSKIGINSFEQFIIYFSSYDKDSEEMKKIYSLLDKNPLLRYRIYEIKKKFNKSKNILNLIDKHNKIITWQIKRIYRIRNLSTHLGQQDEHVEFALYNLHNYFDFVINYILCNNENGRKLSSINQLVFETQNDYAIHRELLKKDEKLNKDNYINLLFGGDRKLIQYEFEFFD
jgi:hypothetical protein